MHVTLGSGVLSISNSGADVVLTQFPASGGLGSFGLNPATIKTLAIPNDIRTWPTLVLSGCTNLEKITVYGPEAEEGTIILSRNHGLYDLGQLRSIQIPSTVTVVGGSPISGAPTFPTSLQFVYFSSRLTGVDYSAFYGVSLVFADFSRCKKLQFIDYHAFRGTLLSSLDLSACSLLGSILNAAFFFCNQLHCVTFPASLTRIDTAAFETGGAISGGAIGIPPSPVKTIIWKGRSTRPAIDDETGIHTNAFTREKTIDELVSSGQITEIFVP